MLVLLSMNLFEFLFVTYKVNFTFLYIQYQLNPINNCKLLLLNYQIFKQRKK